MTLNRRSSIKANNRKFRGVRGLNGNRLCRYCQIEVSPPRRTFCSDTCVHEWKLRSSTKYLREHVYERDLGICALCKIDTRYQKIEIENSRRLAKVSGSKDGYLDFVRKLSLTEKESLKSIWHADHILPVSHGGGETGLDNIRTLCIKCHKTETKKLNGKKKNERSK